MVNNKPRDLLWILWFQPEAFQPLLYEPKHGFFAFIIKYHGPAMLQDYKRRLGCFMSALKFPVRDWMNFKFAIVSLIVTYEEVRNYFRECMKVTGDEQAFDVFVPFLVAQHQRLRSKGFNSANSAKLMHEFMTMVIPATWVTRDLKTMRNYNELPMEIEEYDPDKKGKAVILDV